MIAVALALLALGALIGAGGMRRLGRMVRGPWRPGAGVLGVVAVFVGLALAARGQVVAALVVLIAGGAALAAARAPRRSTAPRPSRASLDRREAAEILGVSIDASAAEVEAAHRRLIRVAHPDAGGTAGLAARLNAARATLLRR